MKVIGRLLTPRVKKRLAPYLLLSPAFFLLAVVLIYPLIYNTYLSFMSWRLTSSVPSKFVGFQNYINLFLHDPAQFDSCPVYSYLNVCLG